MLRAIVATAFIFTAANAGHAGGIEEDHEHDGTNQVFFGVVQDTRGAAIAGANVNLTYKGMSFVVSTDAIGGYRMAVPTDRDQSVISCRKTGYRQTGTMRRTPPDIGKGPVEIDCTLQRTP